MAGKIGKNCTRKKNELEASLIESEEKFRLLLELTTNGVFVVQNGKIKEVNYCLAKMCGYGLEELTDTCFASFFRAEDIGLVETLCGDAIETKNAAESLEATLVCKNGHRS
jgi:PAS domain S-box-containing protein